MITLSSISFSSFPSHLLHLQHHQEFTDLRSHSQFFTIFSCSKLLNTTHSFRLVHCSSFSFFSSAVSLFSILVLWFLGFFSLSSFFFFLLSSSSASFSFRLHLIGFSFRLLFSSSGLLRFLRLQLLLSPLSFTCAAGSFDVWVFDAKIVFGFYGDSGTFFFCLLGVCCAVPAFLCYGSILDKSSTLKTIYFSEALKISSL